MSKVTFAKLGLTKNQENKIIEWNNQNIEVKLYLPIGDKVDLISKIITLSIDANGYYSPCKVELFTAIEIFLTYTGITLTEKLSEDILKVYDLLVGSGLYDKIYNLIPESEISFIKENVYAELNNFYHFKNSVLGIMEALANDYDKTKFDAEVIQKTLGDQNAVGVVKEVISKLG